MNSDGIIFDRDRTRCGSKEVSRPAQTGSNRVTRPPQNIDGIIFDLDGTLWDSCRIVAESWGYTLRTKYASQQAPTKAEVRSVMGLTVSQIAEKLFSDYGNRALEICTDCIREENSYLASHGGGTPYPGLEELFCRLSERCGLYIVSNCIDGYIQCFLSCTGLGKYIKDFECEGVTGMKKADNIALIAQRNGLKRYIYVGDTSSDEESAALAGCPFVHASYGFGTAKAPAAVIGAPLELLAVVDAMDKENHNA